MESDQTLGWLDAHYRAMPPVAALELRPARLHDGMLMLSAPLTRHVNDKGCAFGGSLTSLMTLAGWGLVNVHLRAAGLAAEVYVADSHVRYLKPVYSELRARARLAEGEVWAAFLERLRGRRKAVIAIDGEVALDDGNLACCAQSRYVAVARR